jgi:hypothetical protein
VPDDLEQLSTEELRHRAFRTAERRVDAHFFWDLIEHLPAAEGLAEEDGTTGGLTGGLTELIIAVRELFGHDLGDAEPLLRARFIDYLRDHE